ncbi:hypothetical protein [Maricaulis sp.]|uniref:hypothetical protein n=1 Tax=Maricaulis sp. TaxID=1486257 RepID=UPI003A924CFF
MKHSLFACAALTALTASAGAHPVNSPQDTSVDPAFDITRVTATTDGRLVTFMMEVAGVAGSVTPEPTGQLAGANVEAYVWPTNLDPAVVGFDAGSGTLALAITAHPDFDDTPLFDENGDGDPANDGAGWHSHWVVLTADEACGAGLKVRDVSPGQDLLPATAPYLPIALDSPGMSPVIDGHLAQITVPLADGESVSFDGVTASLHVNDAGTAPLLCVSGVHDIASGDLSLPGVIMASEPH